MSTQESQEATPDLSVTLVQLEHPLAQLSAGLSALMCMSTSELQLGVEEIDWFAGKLLDDLNSIRDQLDEVFKHVGMKPLTR